MTVAKRGNRGRDTRRIGIGKLSFLALLISVYAATKSIKVADYASSLMAQSPEAVLVLNNTNPDRDTSKPKQQQHKCLNDDFVPEHEYSVWTMLNDNPQYTQGAVKNARAIRSQTKTPLDLVVLELSTKPLSDQEWNDLKEVGWKRCVVSPITPPQLPRRNVHHRIPKFSWLHVWAMTCYSKLVFLDADTYAYGPLDDLFQKIKLTPEEPIGFSKDIRRGKWADTFNAGVMLMQPNVTEYERLLELAKPEANFRYEFDMSDQGFANAVYKGKWKNLGHAWNANLAVYSSNRGFWDCEWPKVNIIHYTMSKPWDCRKGYRPICDLWHDGANENESSSKPKIRLFGRRQRKQQSS